MALLMASVENGKILNNSTEESTAAAKKKQKAESTSGLDKEAFLQLLVAQMQYQDPLEPMDNTEYVAQLATFSQLEATQNLSNTISYGMANDLVGKYVILNTDMGTVNGKVDYVMYENGDIYLAVGDGIYSIDDLDTVADGAYYEAFQMAGMFSSMIAKLPSPSNVTSADADAIKNARSVYDAMNSYQQGFVSKEDLEKLEALEKKIKEMTGSSESEGDGEEEETGKDDKDVADA